MIGYTEQQRMITEAIANFPAEFGLRTFPGETFRISPSSSYVNDSGELMLYTEVKKADKWLSFAKGSIAELSDYICPLPGAGPAPAPKHLSSAQVSNFNANQMQLAREADQPPASGIEAIRALKDAVSFIHRDNDGFTSSLTLTRADLKRLTAALPPAPVQRMSAGVSVQLLDAAQEKFGDILATRPHPNGGTLFLIRRSQPANPSLPYMTIRGIVSRGGNCDFAFGHYDMSEQFARQDFDGR